MPASASSPPPPPPPTNSRHEDLIGRLSSSSTHAKLKALRDLKNQIIGNRTKKLCFLKLGAVPPITSILSSAAGGGDDAELNVSLIIQSAAAIGSFACGFDDGVKAVLDAGVFNILLSLISYPNDKVVSAAARSLKFIYQSKLAPRYDFLQGNNMEFIQSLLNSENENVTGLGASIITHSCQTNMQQKALSDTGIIKKLICMLGGSVTQKEASLESLATILKGNPDVILKFMEPENGGALGTVNELTKDKNARTRLLACMCLIVIRNSSPSCLQDLRIKTKLILILLELLEDDQVGDEAPFALSSLIAEKEDLQVLAFEANVIDKLVNHLRKGPLLSRRLEGILIALANMCSRLERCRDRLLSLEAMKFVTDALSQDSGEVRAAACICLKNVSRSVKNLSAGLFMNENFVVPLVRLLFDDLTFVQVSALDAISNIVVDFLAHKKIFMQCGGVKQLVQLSKSMDSTIRVKAVCALRNLTFLVNDQCKEEILSELTQLTLGSLICDPETCVQEQSLSLVRNLVDGPLDSIQHVFAEDALLLHAVGQQLQSASKAEVLIQGMYVFTNVASGNEVHKEAVMQELFPPLANDSESVMLKFLHSDDSRLRTAAVWALVNLTFPSSSGAFGRVMKLRNAGVVSQLKNMVNDPCLDVKLRARTALGQSMTSDDGST
ncbi:putative armadillo repeat-containing protein 8-like isoform X2 [Capsicum annuum]|uniref:armadillo repeat-containing protein 8 isoform X1 n=1 Tax=Capsicum annuum TaxID=4072 RepID=UPI001FB10BE2|nr:armadillo repeat-containing protein 8 isoform X1 [Capsicum annuum]XP_016547238.2 armadillo repeat-containing protein 8 isoform X1 [Capsicum annuum]XP_016547239.2 armadillo repeat-containing protein 8 isoform X1 [Capsicum annuum]XP_016547240.2 armadillo repeat-containing protein 8 isoform X1 [Capsicum annuum]KAF3666337.1 putative armadillo repeat-containing protein 8-like isoform X2 [Capsicum annuum]